MSAVTVPRKCYVFVCAACWLLADTRRAHTITCSPACRVRLHRNPEKLARLQRDAELHHVTVAMILQGAAIDMLCPELGNEILAGAKTFDDVRLDVYRAYLDRVRAATRAIREHEATA